MCPTNSVSLSHIHNRAGSVVGRLRPHFERFLIFHHSDQVYINNLQLRNEIRSSSVIIGCCVMNTSSASVISFSATPTTHAHNILNRRKMGGLMIVERYQR